MCSNLSSWNTLKGQQLGYVETRGRPKKYRAICPQALHDIEGLNQMRHGQTLFQRFLKPTDVAAGQNVYGAGRDVTASLFVVTQNDETKRVLGSKFLVDLINDVILWIVGIR